jgi:hypothetical protein
VRSHAHITGGGFDAAVAEQDLDHARVGSIFQQMRGKAVAQRVGGDALGDSRVLGGVAAGDGQRAGGNVMASTPGGEQVPPRCSAR